MKQDWATMKNILAAYGQRNDIFLSLLKEDGTIYCANAKMRKTLHLQNPRQTKTNFFDLLHPANHKAFKSALLNSTRKKNSYFLEISLKNGYYHPMKWQVISLINKKDTDNTYLCVGYTIKNEKILYKNLEEKKNLFQAFLEQTANHTWIVDENNKLVFANDSFCQHYKLNKFQYLDKKIIDIIPARIANILHEKQLLVLEAGLPVETVEKIEWADGTTFIFNINIFLIKDTNGKRLVGGQAINITAGYNAAEKQLHEAKDRLLLLSRTTSDAIWEWDMQNGNMFRNDALMDMIGYQQENIKGLSWWLRRIHPKDRNRVTDKIKEATDQGRHSWEEEYRFKCADNTYKHIQDHGYVVYENGLPVKMIGSLQDISSIKELQHQLTEEKLQRQREISETIIKVQEEERSRFGHELHDNVNQILSTVKLFVDMLTPTTKEQTKIKEKSLEYVMMAINEIRKLSKELVVSQLQGENLIKSIRMMTDDIQLSSSIKIKFTHDHENDLLSPGKKVMLFRILQEQMKNILVHSKANNVDIYLDTKEGNTQLIIKDDGTGFDLKQTYQGIGLSNIHERTRFYNGSVDIQTSPGNGCTLVVTIPSS